MATRSVSGIPCSRSCCVPHHAHKNRRGSARSLATDHRWAWRSVGQRQRTSAARNGLLDALCAAAVVTRCVPGRGWLQFWAVLVLLATVGAAPPTAPRVDSPSRRTCCVTSLPQEEMFCHEFILADLRVYDNCAKVLKGCEHCFNLAADMGGMGFIQSNHGVIFYNNTMISFNMLEAARKEGITRCALGHQVRSDRPTH